MGIRRKRVYVIIAALLFLIGGIVNIAVLDTGYFKLRGVNAEEVEMYAQEAQSEVLADVDSSEWSYLTDFTLYEQQRSYYCVPAAIQSAMTYLTGESPSQVEIAAELGTENTGTSFNLIRKYLNQHQEENWYIHQWSWVSLETMQRDFENAINVQDSPPIISVRVSKEDGWAYDSSGHVMLVVGNNEDLSEFKLADPYMRRVDSSASGFYDKDAVTIKDAIQKRGNGYVY